VLTVPALRFKKYHGRILWQEVGDKLNLAVRVMDVGIDIFVTSNCNLVDTR
jgi:hypothetical protein